MSGGNPALAISPYIISRDWWLHELRRYRSLERVAMGTSQIRLRKSAQRELCKLRKEKYK